MTRLINTSQFGLFLGKRACVGYENGSLRIWDLKGGTILHSVSGNYTTTSL